MSKIISAVSEAIPYRIQVGGYQDLEGPAGGDALFRLRLHGARMGLLHSLRVDQVAGPLDGYTARVFSCADACPPGTTTPLITNLATIDDSTLAIAARHPNVIDRAKWRVGPGDWVAANGESRITGGVSSNGWVFLNNDAPLHGAEWFPAVNLDKPAGPKNRRDVGDQFAIYIELEPTGGFAGKVFIAAASIKV